MKYYLLIASALILLGGCNPYSSKIKTISISGIVQMEGKPIENAEVAFSSESHPMAFGITDAEGKYELSTRRYGKGAAPGTYTVKIHMTDQTSEGGSGRRVQIPKVYSDNGIASVTIGDSEQRNFDFQLVSKPSRKAADWDNQTSEQ